MRFNTDDGYNFYVTDDGYVLPQQRQFSSYVPIVTAVSSCRFPATMSAARLAGRKQQKKSGEKLFVFG